MGTDKRQAILGELASEVAELREENARLRGLLGLDARSGDGHEMAWAPTLLVEPPNRVSVHSESPDAEKLALLWSLFGARSDVHATRWESASTGKSGWSPATRGGWSKRRSAKDHLPLTDEVLLGHLRGESTLGIYPSCGVTHARCWRAISTRARGRSIRWPTSTRATPTAYRLRWSGPGQATAGMSGCSSTVRCRHRRRERWAPRCLDTR